MKGFKIDFFELSFLAEACIPPRPIARAMFWDKLCNEYYHQLSEDERGNLFEWIQKNPSFDLGNEDCRLFYARYNPDNQYTVITNFDGVREEHQAFRFKDSYHLSKGTSIQDKFITEVIKK